MNTGATRSTGTWSVHRSTDSIEARSADSEVVSNKSFSSSNKRVTLDLEGYESVTEQQPKESLATQADIESLLQKMQQLMQQVKNDLISEQRHAWKAMLGGISTSIPEEGILGGPDMRQPTASLNSVSQFRKKAPTGPRRLSNKGQAAHLAIYKSDISGTPPVYDSHGSRSGAQSVGKQSSVQSKHTVQSSSSTRRSSNRTYLSYFSSGSAKNKEPTAIQKEREKRKSRFGHEHITQMTDIHARGSASASALGSNQEEHMESEMTMATQLTGFNKMKRRCDEIILSPNFDAGCGILIMLNAVLIGIETEMIAQGGGTTLATEMLQHILNIWYLFELLMRLSAQKWEFITGEERNWNMFDTFLVCSALLDLFLTSFASDSLKTARVLRVIRLFRIVRTLRIIRQFKYVREFRKMVCSLLASVQTLFWSLLLVFGVMYTFALWFTQSAADFQTDSDGKLEMVKINEDIQSYYSSFSRTVFSLFAAISGGYSWHVLVDPWIAANENMSVFFFIAYICTAVFGLMNIVTSVFVESAMHATKHFQDLLVDEKKKDLEMYMTHMETIFHVIDEDGGGSISFEEMAAFLEDAGSELPQYLEALGITSKDVWVLFKLLDTDDTGSIDIKEFCEGCMRLKGEARSFDINCMMYESRAMIRYQADFMEFVEERFEFLERQNHQMLDFMDKRFAVRITALSSKLNMMMPSSRRTETNPDDSQNLMGHHPPHYFHDKPMTPKLLKKTSFSDEVEIGPEPPLASACGRLGASRFSQHLYHEQKAPAVPKSFFDQRGHTCSSSRLEAEFNAWNAGKQAAETNGSLHESATTTSGTNSVLFPPTLPSTGMPSTD